MPRLADLRPQSQHQEKRPGSKQWKSGPLLFRWVPLPETDGQKVLWIIRKKSGPATLRNALRRRMREAFFHRTSQQLPAGLFLFIVDKEPYKESLSKFWDNIVSVWEQAFSYWQSKGKFKSPPEISI